jgi:hypothetical protein
MEASSRDFYFGESRRGHRAARRLAATAAYEDLAIEEMNRPLPEETAAALQDQRMTKALALHWRRPKPIGDWSTPPMSRQPGQPNRPNSTCEEAALGDGSSARNFDRANPSFRFARTANTKAWASSTAAANCRPGANNDIIQTRSQSKQRRAGHYHITNSRGDIVGSVSVKPDEVAALQKCWRDSAPTAAATARGEKACVVNAMLAATERDHG